MKYIVISASNLTDLYQKVEEHINIGYIPQGGISAIPHTTDPKHPQYIEAINGQFQKYFQAMITDANHPL